MPRLSSKRQITIPKEVCDRLHIRPGDEIDLIEHEGRVTFIKKRKGSSHGTLKHLQANVRYTDEDSLISTVVTKRASPVKRKRRDV